MAQEDKELLLKDLSSRLPYGTIVRSFIGKSGENDEILNCVHIINFYAYDCKPYLRPMSSMAEEEKVELSCLFGGIPNEDYIYKPYTDISYSTFGEVIDWLNKHHFDYMGLIEKGLALEASKGMYNIKKK